MFCALCTIYRLVQVANILKHNQLGNDSEFFLQRVLCQITMYMRPGIDSNMKRQTVI